MNWIIEQALQEYLKRHHKMLLIDAAVKDVIYLQSKGEEDDF